MTLSHNRAWSFGEFITVYVVTAIIAAFLLPGLDSLSPLRFKCFAGLSILYWARFVIARFRKETNRTYLIWMIVIGLSPFCIMLIGLCPLSITFDGMK